MCVYKSGGDLELGWWCYALHLLYGTLRKIQKKERQRCRERGLVEME